MILLAIRSRVLGPNLLVIMMRKPASGKLNLGGLELRISSTMTTGGLPYCDFSFTMKHNAVISVDPSEDSTQVSGPLPSPCLANFLELWSWQLAITLRSGFSSSH
jgi:hypothetical protein